MPYSVWGGCAIHHNDTEESSQHINVTDILNAYDELEMPDDDKKLIATFIEKLIGRPVE